MGEKVKKITHFFEALQNGIEVKPMEQGVENFKKKMNKLAASGGGETKSVLRKGLCGGEVMPGLRKGVGVDKSGKVKLPSRVGTESGDYSQ